MQIDSSTVAFVAGGASGLGEATARALAAEGARIGILDLNGSRAAELGASLGGAGFACDVTSAEGAEAAVAQATEALGAPRILVNCAGVGTPQRIVGREGPYPLDFFERVVRINLIGTYNMMRLAAGLMQTLEPVNADGERGVIVCTASVAAYDGQIGQAAYAASKGGVASLTLPAARELARSGIRVVTIAPGIFATPMLEALPEEVQASLAASIPFPQRLGAPAEFAALASHIVENGMLNGEVIRLDGAIRMAPK